MSPYFSCMITNVLLFRSKLCLSIVRLTLSSCWMSLEVSVQPISTWWSLLYHSWSAGWTLTVAKRASGSSPSRQSLEAGLTWVLTPQLLRFNQPLCHSVTQVAKQTRLLRLPMFVLRCWLQRQVIVPTHLTLLSFSLMDNRLIDR